MNLEKHLRVSPAGLEIHDFDGVITSLPEDFFDAHTHIHYLHIYGTGITALPSSFDKLTGLKHLKLATKIKSFPEAISQFNELHSLHIRGNTIDFNKDAVKLSGLPQLTELELFGYRGTSFPTNIALLKGLRKLRLSDDLKKKLTIKDVFETVAKLPVLEELDFGVPVADSDIDETFLKIDHVKQLTGYGWRFAYHSEKAPLLLGRTKQVLFQYTLGEKLAAFRQRFNSPSLSDRQLELLFGMFIKNFTAVNERLPNLLQGRLAEKKPVNLIILDKPKGESAKSIKESLKSYPITINGTGAENSVVVIGPRTTAEEAEPYIVQGYDLATVDHLKEVLVAEADPWLLQEENGSSNAQLLQLLTSNQTENYLIAFQIIETGGANKAIQSLLAAIMLSHPETKVAKAATKLYDKYGSGSFKHHAEALKISLKRSGDTLRKVNALVNHPDIDAFAFRLMHHLIAGSNKNIADLPAHIFTIKNVPDIQITEVLPFFTHIKELHFEGCERFPLKEAIPLLKEMTTCRVLKLNGCKTTVPASIAELTHLQVLEIGGNEVAAPGALTSLQNLKRLDVEGTKIGEWEWLQNLVSLESLNISHNALAAIPTGILAIKNLKELEASHNHITEIDPRITELTELGSIDCSNNKINSFPYFLAKLQKLGRLLLRSNTIAEFDSLQIISTTQAEELPWTTLNLSRNKLTSFSLGSLHLGHLQVLDISYNAITALDHSVFQSGSLRELYAQGNAIPEIPEAVSRVGYFDKLWLQGNRITALPEYMARVRVQNCDLSDNQIHFIHPDFDVIGKDNYGRLYWKIRNNPVSESLVNFGGLYGHR